MTEAAKLSFLQQGLDQVALIVDDLDQAVRARRSPPDEVYPPEQG